MSQVSRLSVAPSDPDEERDAAVMKAVMTLLDTLPEARRQIILQKLSSSTKPIVGRKSNEMMSIVINFIKDKKSWSVSQIKEEILQKYAETNPKEIYNTVNYLAKSGRIRRIGYGRYEIDGNLVVSSDDLAGNPFPNDDQADN